MRVLSSVSVAPTALGRFSAVFPGLTPGANLCRAYGAGVAPSLDLATGGLSRRDGIGLSHAKNAERGSGVCSQENQKCGADRGHS